MLCKEAGAVKNAAGRIASLDRACTGSGKPARRPAGLRENVSQEEKHDATLVNRSHGGFGADRHAGHGARECAANSLRVGAELPKISARCASRRSRRRCGQFQGPHLRLFALRFRHRPGLRQRGLEAPRVHAGRPVHPRNRQGPLRLVVRPHGAHRRRRQYLGHRQGLGHDHQVRQRKRPGDDGVRPQVGSPPTRTRIRWSTPIRRCPPSMAGSASRPMSPGTRRAMPISATATSIRASPRSTRTATG